MKKTDMGAVWNKSQLINYMAKTNDVSVQQAKEAYEMTIEAIKDIVVAGYPLRLVGFGLFYLQMHKGNPTQFRGGQSNGVRSEDYLVFKFSAATTLNKLIRSQFAASHGGRVRGSGVSREASAMQA